MAATAGLDRDFREAAPALIRDLAERGVSRIVWTPIEVDGTMEGPPLHQLHVIADELDAELIYSGGVGTLADLEALAAVDLPALGGVIVGRALYEGRFDVADALAALES